MYHYVDTAFFLVSVPCFVTSAAICVTSALSCVQSLSQLALHFSSLSCACNLISNAFTLAQDIVSQRKTCCMVAQRGSCPRCVTHHGRSSGTIASSAGAAAARTPECYRTIRILTLQVNSNASAATTTAPATTTAGSHSQMPKVNHQFGKDIISNIFDGKQRNDFREWAENSALYLSPQCVDACKIILEWLVSEKEHVTDTEIQTRCDVENWEYDNINTFSRVQFVYLSMRTTGTSRKKSQMAKGVTD